MIISISYILFYCTKTHFLSKAANRDVAVINAFAAKASLHQCLLPRKQKKCNAGKEKKKRKRKRNAEIKVCLNHCLLGRLNWLMLIGALCSPVLKSNLAS